jgi:hypothetical protein
MGTQKAILERQAVPDLSGDLIIEQLTRNGPVADIDNNPCLCMPPPTSPCQTGVNTANTCMYSAGGSCDSDSCDCGSGCGS